VIERTASARSSRYSSHGSSLTNAVKENALVPARVIGWGTASSPEVAEQLARPRRPDRSNRLHEQVSADEGTLPRLTHAAEHLLPITPAARSIDAYLERLQLLGYARREVHVVGRQAGH
jgi:hypothetical protein